MAVRTPTMVRTSINSSSVKPEGAGRERWGARIRRSTRAPAQAGSPIFNDSGPTGENDSYSGTLRAGLGNVLKWDSRCERPQSSFCAVHATEPCASCRNLRRCGGQWCFRVLTMDGGSSGVLTGAVIRARCLSGAALDLFTACGKTPRGHSAVCCARVQTLSRTPEPRGARGGGSVASVALLLGILGLAVLIRPGRFGFCRGTFVRRVGLGCLPIQVLGCHAAGA